MTGMLWFDESNLDLSQKVTKAVERYRAKYGKEARTCFVNKAVVPQMGVVVNGVKVVPAKFVLPNHFIVFEGEDGEF